MRAALYVDCHDCRDGLAFHRRSELNDVHTCTCHRRWRLVQESRWRLLWAALMGRRVLATHGDLMWVYDGLNQDGTR